MRTWYDISFAPSSRAIYNPFRIRYWYGRYLVTCCTRGCTAAVIAPHCSTLDLQVSVCIGLCCNLYIRYVLRSTTFRVKKTKSRNPTFSSCIFPRAVLHAGVPASAWLVSYDPEDTCCPVVCRVLQQYGETSQCTTPTTDHTAVVYKFHEMGDSKQNLSECYLRIYIIPSDVQVGSIPCIIRK